MPTLRTVINIAFPSGGGPGVNVFHFRTTADLEDGNEVLETVGAGMETCYTLLRAQYAQGVVLSWDGTWVDVDTQREITAGAPWTITATSNTGTLPPATQVCVTWLTGTRSRSGRGRTFIGPLTQAAADAQGTPSAACLTAVNGFAAAMVELGDGAQGGFGVYSRTDGVIRDWTGRRVRDVFAVLRSRRD